MCVLYIVLSCLLHMCYVCVYIAGYVICIVCRVFGVFFVGCFFRAGVLLVGVGLCWLLQVAWVSVGQVKLGRPKLS